MGLLTRIAVPIIKQQTCNRAITGVELSQLQLRIHPVMSRFTEPPHPPTLLLGTLIG